MKFLAAAVLGVLLTLSLANDNVDVNNSGNDGGNVNQQVNINNQDRIANINRFNGWDSWDSICDYGNGFAATRLYKNKICVINKMKSNFPTLQQLKAISENNQVPQSVDMTTYTINQKPIINIGEYGRHIEALCKGMPAYTAIELPQAEEGFALCHTNSMITILGISFCF
ncbi:PREDICTED: gastrokine-1-like [Nanorana parkeri]|uniref:gastrokine-1-like n=1 Tax=Nanorana parkeri TaxID=125878 RepID=UPI000854E2A0|nr:PREDICTED: gastrokine-1-like [Nanorana parkeri]